jgi:large subunit ribosomal protein L18
MLRRRREMKTNYKQRLALLKARKPRLVVRRNQNNIRCQLIQYDKSGDRTLAEVTSKKLSKFGWKPHAANLPAAYLAGMLIGFESLKKGIKEAVVDIGLQRSTKANALYACVAGALEAGMHISVEKGVLPDKERAAGRHIAQFAAALKKTPDRYKRQFSSYLKAGVEPEKIEGYFDIARNKILEEFRDVKKLADFEETAKKFLGEA